MPTLKKMSLLPDERKGKGREKIEREREREKARKEERKLDLYI